MSRVDGGCGIGGQPWCPRNRVQRRWRFIQLRRWSRVVAMQTGHVGQGDGTVPRNNLQQIGGCTRRFHIQPTPVRSAGRPQEIGRPQQRDRAARHHGPIKTTEMGMAQGCQPIIGRWRRQPARGGATGQVGTAAQGPPQAAARQTEAGRHCCHRLSRRQGVGHAGPGRIGQFPGIQSRKLWWDGHDLASFASHKKLFLSHLARRDQNQGGNRPISGGACPSPSRIRAARRPA